jgi:hypothetical protein
MANILASTITSIITSIKANILITKRIHISISISLCKIASKSDSNITSKNLPK